MAGQSKQPGRIPSQVGIFDYLRDIRVIQAIAQIIFVIVLVFVLSILWSNVLSALEERNLVPTFNFLSNRGGIPITESPEWYSTESSYGQAFIVGVINTLRVVSVGLVLATVIGVLMGIFLLSRNWLVKTLSRAYVEILRNTPLLVQLVFWYYAVLLSLPADDITLPSEGVMTIPWRFLLYALTLILVWLFARRSSYPSEMNFGAFAAVVVMEVLARIFGFTNDLIGVTTVTAAIVLLVASFVPVRWRSLVQAIVLVPFVQFLGHFFFYIFEQLSILPNARMYVSEVYPVFFISRKGFVFPEILATSRFNEWMAFVGLGFVLAISIWVVAKHIEDTTGRPIQRGLYAFLSVLFFAVVGWFIVAAEPPPKEILLELEDGPTYVPLEEAREQDLLELSDLQLVGTDPLIIALPQKPRFRFEVGTLVPPEYLALLLGLSIYTSAVIAEIVRAGIQAVPYGQIEAARAVGLTRTQTLSRIILPQALRVIIPPMGNQYLNLSKNSSLATAVAFADTYQVGTTMMNQSGQSVTGFALVLIVYLSLSLIISAFMNFVNSRFQLVTR